MKNDNQALATEIIHDMKIRSRRYFIIAIIFAVLFVVSNLLWYSATTTKSISNTYSLNGHDNANVVFNDSGEVDISEEINSQ